MISSCSPGHDNYDDDNYDNDDANYDDDNYDDNYQTQYALPYTYRAIPNMYIWRYTQYMRCLRIWTSESITLAWYHVVSSQAQSVSYEHDEQECGLSQPNTIKLTMKMTQTQ